MPRLLFPNGERPPHELRPGRQVLGRIVDCDIVIGVTDVSREHAAIFLEDGAVYVQDLGSKNGTFVNGKRLETNVKTRLTLGDEVKFGVVDSIFEEEIPTSSAELPAVAAAAPPPAEPRPSGTGGRAAGREEAPAPASAPVPPKVRRARRRVPGTSAPLAPILLGVMGVCMVGGAIWYKKSRPAASTAKRGAAPVAADRPSGSSGEPIPEPLIARAEARGPGADMRSPAAPRLARRADLDEARARGGSPGDLPLTFEERERIRMGIPEGGGPRPASAKRDGAPPPASPPPPGPPPRAEPPTPVSVPKRVPDPAVPVEPPAGTPVVAADDDEEIEGLVKLARGGDPAAKATLKALQFVALRHDGALAPGRAEKLLHAVRERIARAQDARFVTPARLESVRQTYDKARTAEIEIRTSYTQDYTRGYGRLVAPKARLAPHPKTLKVEIVEILAGPERKAKTLHSWSVSTPAALEKQLEEKPGGLDDAAVWDATLAGAEEKVASWSGKL